MNTTLDIYLSFPCGDDSDFDELVKICGSIEHVEEFFDMEFSCGDGKYLSDLWSWSDNNQGLSANVSDEELDKYDGQTDLESLPRFRDTKQLFKTNKSYHFVAKYSEQNETVTFFLNGKIRSTKDESNL